MTAATPPDGSSEPRRQELKRLCADNLMSNVPELSVYFKDLESRFILVSKGQADNLGAGSPEDVIGKTDADFFSEEHWQQALVDEQEIIRTGAAMPGIEERQTFHDRPDNWVLASKYPLRDYDGSVIGTFGISRDITRLVQAEVAALEQSAQLSQANTELRRVESEMRSLLEGSPDAIVKLDVGLKHVYANPKAGELFGVAVEDMLGRSNRELGLSHGNVEQWERTVRRVFESGVPAEYESVHESGERRWFFHTRIEPLLDDEGIVNGVLVASRDMTDWKLAEEALAHQAVHDPVTGLPNRVLFQDRVEHALALLERKPGIAAVLFLDLDRFKVVNDSLGHTAGDQLLREVARRLTATARRGDTVARFGGDEFVLLCENVAEDDIIRVLAGRIADALAEPFVLDGHSVSVSASIGIATTSDARTGAEVMVRDADAAMYHAKEMGRGRYEFFDARVRDRANERIGLETSLRSALERKEFFLVYQPLVSLRDELVTGVEALIRWEHPERGVQQPADFIPVAEESRLVVAIDRWVLDEACRQLRAWNAERPGLAPLTMAVNISGRQLSEPDVVEAVQAILAKHSMPASLLCIEITETAMLQEISTAVTVCERLSALGVQIALDDFGTGYSSLAHLKRFPVDILKIDRSFVDRMHAGNDESAIVAAVTGMARALGMRTIGEGIETAEQLADLTGLGCNEGQGFLLARPARAEQIRAALGLA